MFSLSAKMPNSDLIQMVKCNTNSINLGNDHALPNFDHDNLIFNCFNQI